MIAVGLGDLAAAAAALMAVPEGERAARMQAMLRAAERADAFRRATGRRHPMLGNATLMAAALAQGGSARAGPGDPAWLDCLAQALEAVIAHCATQGARASSAERGLALAEGMVGDERFELPTSSM